MQRPLRKKEAFRAQALEFLAAGNREAALQCCQRATTITWDVISTLIQVRVRTECIAFLNTLGRARVLLSLSL